MGHPRYYCVQACDRLRGWVTLDELASTKLHEVIRRMELVSSFRPRWALRTHKMPHSFEPPTPESPEFPEPEDGTIEALIERVVNQPPFTDFKPRPQSPEAEITASVPLPNYTQLREGLQEFLWEALSREEHHFYVESHTLYAEYMKGIPKGLKCSAKHTYLANIEELMRQAGYESHDKGLSYYPK